MEKITLMEPKSSNGTQLVDTINFGLSKRKARVSIEYALGMIPPLKSVITMMDSSSTKARSTPGKFKDSFPKLIDIFID